mmetsp:Transcript_145886/g.269017  ORF Transcript_145886/g.269017 Transcript_145886/m.269017 type:complete len:540 (-) Transcript_145886:57-1676(-)
MRICLATTLLTAALPCFWALGQADLSRSLDFIKPTPCTTLHSSGPLNIDVSLKHNLSKGQCVILHVRSSPDKAWWFMVPPSPLKDKQYRFCVKKNLELSGAVALQPGYTRLAAWWSQPSDSSEKIPPVAVSYISLLPAGEEHDVAEIIKISGQAREERSVIAEDPAKSSMLSERYKPMAKHSVLQGATIATPGLFDTKLVKALADGSPKALFKVIKDAGDPLMEESAATSDWKSSPWEQDQGLPWYSAKRSDEPILQPGVYRLPIFSAEMAEILLQELEAANDSPLAAELTAPQDAQNAFRNPGEPPGAVMLAEIGLGSLGDSLIQDVIKPIARLVFPHWDGDGIDSWHAFSIHRRIPTKDEYAEKIWDFITRLGPQKVAFGAKFQGADPGAIDAAMAAPDPAQALNATLLMLTERNGWVGTNIEADLQRVRERKETGHNDICEISINICLGRNFTDSGVFFAGFSGLHETPVTPMWVPQVPGTGYIHVCQHQHGVIGPRAGERHSIIVRALSSRFRAAPAETFAAQCLSESETCGKHR